MLIGFCLRNTITPLSPPFPSWGWRRWGKDRTGTYTPARIVLYPVPMWGRRRIVCLTHTHTHIRLSSVRVSRTTVAANTRATHVARQSRATCTWQTIISRALSFSLSDTHGGCLGEQGKSVPLSTNTYTHIRW